MLDEFRSTSITWDKATRRIYSPITANASDENGRKLVVQIVNGGQVEDLTGATLHLYWETRDKVHDGLDVFKAVDLKKGEFELSYTTGMLSNKGVLNANLVLIDTVGRVVSERFKITVTEGIDNDAIQSENSFSSLTQALIDISNLEQNYAPRLNDLTAQLQQTEQELSSQLAQKATKQALEVEKVRFNTLASLEEGSTTGDAELIDARVGADGLTYSSAGHAIREQLNNIHEGTEIINLLSGEWLDSTTLSNYNVYTKASNARYSAMNGEVDVSNYVGEMVTLKMKPEFVSSCIIGLDDTSNNFLSRTSYSSTTEIVTIEIPENTKILKFVVMASELDYVAQSKESVSLTVAKTGISLNEVREKVITTSNLNTLLLPTETKNVELVNGTYNPTTEAYTPTNISVMNKEPIKLSDLISLTFSKEMNLFIREFDNTGNYLGAATYSGLSFTKTTTTEMKKTEWTFKENTDTVTLVISTDRQNPVEISPSYVTVLMKYTNDRTRKLEETTKKLSPLIKPNYAYAMNSVLCIGDSFTSGAYFGSTDIWASRGTSIDQNYPRVLGRMLNTKVVNAGMSGIDSTNWYATEYDKFIDDTGEDETKWYDTFIIWLGANGGYSDTFSSDIEQYGTNYTQYADTAVGNLGKIIQRIKDNHPNRLIVILNLFGEPNPSGKSNEVISQVSNFFNLVLVDMSDLDTFTRLDLHYGQSFDGHNNPHFNKAGNIFIAERIAKKVNEHLLEDVTRADFGLTARSN